MCVLMRVCPFVPNILCDDKNFLLRNFGNPRQGKRTTNNGMTQCTFILVWKEGFIKIMGDKLNFQKIRKEKESK